MDNDLHVMTVRFVDDRLDLLIGDRLHITPIGVGDLDEIDPPPALLARLYDEFIARIAENSDCIVRRPLVGREWIGIEDASVIGECAASDNHSRPLQQAAVHCLAHRNVGKPLAARHSNARNSGMQDAGHRSSCPESAELGR